MTTDVMLDNSKGYYDIAWTETGDIRTSSALDTAILMSLLEEQRATEDEVPIPELRRGSLVNETADGFEQGNKAWLFSQERITGTVLNDLGPVIRNGLQWLIDDGIAENVQVSTPTIRSGRVVVQIDLFRSGSPVDSQLYELWDLTGSYI